MLGWLACSVAEGRSRWHWLPGGGGDQAPDAIEHEWEPLLTLGVGKQVGGDDILGILKSEHLVEELADCGPQNGEGLGDVTVTEPVQHELSDGAVDGKAVSA